MPLLDSTVRTASIIRMTAVLLQAVFSLVMAGLLLQLHDKLAQVMELPVWAQNGFIATIVVIVFLGIALVLTIAAESLVLVEIDSPPPPSVTQQLTN